MLSSLYVVVLSLYEVSFTLNAVLCLSSLYKVLLSLYAVHSSLGRDDSPGSG